MKKQIMITVDETVYDQVEQLTIEYISENKQIVTVQKIASEIFTEAVKDKASKKEDLIPKTTNVNFGDLDL